MYWKPSVTADLALVNEYNEVLLIKRGTSPFKNSWVIPGGFMDKCDLDLKATALRELREEVKVELNVELKQIGTYSKSGRDPRGMVISSAFYARVKKNEIQFRETEEAVQIKWYRLDKLPKMGFDHSEIIADIPTFKIGLDFHGVIDSHKEQIKKLAKFIKDSGGEVHIITGASELEFKSTQDTIWWDYFYSLKEDVIENHPHWEDNGIWTHDYIWDKLKAIYVDKMGIDIHLDDSLTYGKYFKTGIYIPIGVTK